MTDQVFSALSTLNIVVADALVSICFMPYPLKKHCGCWWCQKEIGTTAHLQPQYCAWHATFSFWMFNNNEVLNQLLEAVDLELGALKWRLGTLYKSGFHLKRHVQVEFHFKNRCDLVLISLRFGQDAWWQAITWISKCWLVICWVLWHSFT